MPYQPLTTPYQTTPTLDLTGGTPLKGGIPPSGKDLGCVPAGKVSQNMEGLWDYESGIWVLEWSHAQKSFHIEPMWKMQRSNYRAFIEMRAMDYVMLAAGTWKEMQDALGRFDGLRYEIECERKGSNKARG